MINHQWLCPLNGDTQIVMVINTKNYGWYACLWSKEGMLLHG